MFINRIFCHLMRIRILLLVNLLFKVKGKEKRGKKASFKLLSKFFKTKLSLMDTSQIQFKIKILHL